MDSKAAPQGPRKENDKFSNLNIPSGIVYRRAGASKMICPSKGVGDRQRGLGGNLGFVEDFRSVVLFSDLYFLLVKYDLSRVFVFSLNIRYFSISS